MFREHLRRHRTNKLYTNLSQVPKNTLLGKTGQGKRVSVALPRVPDLSFFKDASPNDIPQNENPKKSQVFCKWHTPHGCTYYDFTGKFKTPAKECQCQCTGRDWFYPDGSWLKLWLKEQVPKPCPFLQPKLHVELTWN